MKLILNVYGHGVATYVKFHQESDNLVSNGWNLMKLILSIYDHGMVIHINVCQDILCNRGVIAL